MFHLFPLYPTIRVHTGRTDSSDRLPAVSVCLGGEVGIFTSTPRATPPPLSVSTLLMGEERNHSLILVDLELGLV